MQEQFPKSINYAEALSNNIRRLHSNIYTDLYPESNDIEFICPCCGKTKPIKDARVLHSVYETSSVVGRKIVTKYEKFSYRLCDDCLASKYSIDNQKTYAFWIAYAICVIIGIIISFVMGEFYAAAASLLIGWFVGYIIKMFYGWIASFFAPNTDIPFKVAQQYNAIVR